MIDGILPPRPKGDDSKPPNEPPSKPYMPASQYTDAPVDTPVDTMDPFVPPQEIAAADEQAPDTNSIQLTPPEETAPKPKRSLFGWFKNLSTKQKVTGTILAAAVVAGALIGAYFMFFAPAPAAPKQTVKTVAKQETPKPTTVASKLTGLQVDPSINDLPVTAVMIENSADARPQSGLAQAGIVFEAIAEGGITRFVALFQDNSPEYVGPVRSARPYYIEWVLGFDANYAHAGGSPDGLADIAAWGVRDLNHNTTAFWRVDNRVAPHNLYTSIPKLRDYAATKGYGKSDYTPLARKAEAKSKTPTAASINFNISSALFNVRYDYDATTNSYKRSEGGVAHMDEKASAQLTPKVVVALVMPQGLNGKYTTYATVGSGQAYVFQDGTLTIGTWTKTSRTANISLTGPDGLALKLNPGQTWFTALGGTDRISYAP